MLSKKLFLSSAAFFVLVSLPLIGSVGASSEMWSRTYGGAGQEVAYAVVETSDGGYAIAGYTNSSGAGYDDFWLVKTDAYGNMEWNQIYGGVGSERAYSLVVTSDGGFALAGGGLLVKTDGYGNMEWNQTIGGSINSLVETFDGGYALAGYTYSFSAGYDDFWLVKTDSYGNLEWNRTYGGAGFDGASSLVVTSNGGFAIAGGVNGSICHSKGDFWLIKTDAYGNVEWNKTYSSTTWLDYAQSVVETSDGGYAIAGYTGFWSITDVWVVKTDKYGNMEWNQKYGEGVARALVESSDGGYTLAGDNRLVKTDAYGNMEWNRIIGGSIRSLVETSDGGYAIAGTKNDDFWLAKTDEYGVIPEFPSWTIIPLFLTATLAAIFYSKRVRARLRHF